MMLPDTSTWPELGRTANTRYFEIEDGILGALPDEGTKDTGSTAQENCDFQNQHFAKTQPGVVVVFIDSMKGQDGAARAVYQNKPDPELFRGVALVGGTMLSRAMGSFFLGLAKPQVPYKFFRDAEGAYAWARSQIKQGS